MSGETAHAILEKKQQLEEDLRRVEKQIYDLEGEYLQVRDPMCTFRLSPVPLTVTPTRHKLCRRRSRTATSCAAGMATSANRRAVVRSGG